MINIERALKIDGWMSEKELTWLAEQAQDRNIIFEVGVFCGRTTRALADNTNGTVFAIDPFDTSWMESSEVERIDPEAYKLALSKGQYIDEFMTNLLDYSITGKVRIIKKMFENFISYHTPDMIFIDANHSYECVKKDILHALLLASASGTLLCGHDYDALYPGVKRAVDELLPNIKTVSDTSIWYVDFDY